MSPDEDLVRTGFVEEFEGATSTIAAIIRYGDRVRPCRFPFGLRLHKLIPDDGQETGRQSSARPIIRKARELLGRDGAMLVTPASSEEAVTHHAVGKQKKEECQDNYKQEPSNAQPHGPAFFSRRCIQISFHQSRLRNTGARETLPSAPPSASYLAAETVFTEMVVPSAVPVTLACSQANLLRVSSVA